MGAKDRSKSHQLFASACEVLPGGVNSPVRAFPGVGMTPIVAARGKGDLIWDVDGHRYVDYCGGWGALILGHSHSEVIKEAIAQVEEGACFGMLTPVEQELAKKLSHHFPSMEKIRFVSTGTEAVMGAVRLARGFTGKSGVIKFDGNYHGNVDSFLVRSGSGLHHVGLEATSKGVPSDFVRQTVSLPFNDLETVRSVLRMRSDIAAVIIEPIAGNMGVVPASREFLEMLREETARRGMLLIFDEVITGLRVGLGGVQGRYNLVPDLTCLGKIIGGGFPAAAFGGRREVMDLLAPLGEVYQAGTFSGNPVAMRAGLATLRQLEMPGTYERLEAKTESLLGPLKGRKGVCINRIGSMFTIFLGPDVVVTQPSLETARYYDLFRHLFEEGIYFPPSPYETCFVSLAHTEENLLRTKDLLEAYFASH